jgi:hypothetical protein
MLARIDKDATPPGGFRFRVDPQGKFFHYYSLGQIFNAVKDYLNSNHLPVAHDLAQQIEHFTCLDNKGLGCEETNPIAAFKRNLVMNWQAIRSGTLAIGGWMLAGLPFVGQEQADQRSRVCASCTYNEDPKGCAPCQLGSLHTLIEQLIGDRKSAEHGKLMACSRCSCALKVKVWSPLEFLTKSEPVLPLPEWCWLKKEAENG